MEKALHHRKIIKMPISVRDGRLSAFSKVEPKTLIMKGYAKHENN